MKVFVIVFSAILISVVMGVFLIRPTKKLLIEQSFREQELAEKYKILQDSVADLEKKAEILNRYLNMKHLEYIEACNLVYKPQK